MIPINDKGEINLDDFAHLFTERTKIVSIAQVSNVLGTVNPVKEMIKIAHEHDVPVMVDGAQSTPHFAVDVQDMDCDFSLSADIRFMVLPVSVCFTARRNGLTSCLLIREVAK